MKNSPGAVTQGGSARYRRGMRHLQVWGFTLLLASCGETSNFVGSMPDDGGSGGSKANGGTASGGGTSNAGTTSNGGAMAYAGTASGGTSPSGGTQNGGNDTGGATHNGGSGMGGVPAGCIQQSGNWIGCDNGLVHRTAPGKCDSKLPRATAIPPTNPDLDECTKDSECTEKPNGFCDVLVGGFVQVQPHNICAYGCLLDAECAENTVCRCGAFVGECRSATDCKSDQDCSDGALCTQFDSCPGVPKVTDFACQKPADTCTANGDCKDGSKQFCSVNGDHRECVGVHCAI